MNFVINLINRIKDFFFYLFFSASDDFKNKKLLRDIFAEVKKVSYPIYRTDNMVLAGLPILIYEMYQAVLPVYYVLKTTIGSNDIRVSSLYLDKLIEKCFSEQQKIQREAMSLEKRCENIGDFTGPSFEVKMKEQNKMFDSFMASLVGTKFAETDLTINRLYAFFDFCQFKFNDFFAHFDSSFKTAAGTDAVKDKYNFQNVAGNEVLQEILELDYLIRGIAIDDKFTESLYLLSSKTENGSAKEKSSLNKNLQTFSYIIENKLKKTTLRNLVKLIKQDPYFEDKMKPRLEYRALADYKLRFSDIFNADSKKISHIQQEQQIVFFIDKVFTNIKMDKLNRYTAELNTRIQAATKLSLDWVKPLEIIKTYTSQFFQTKCEPFLRDLIVEGVFEDGMFKAALSADYHYCKSILQKIEEFENLMDEKSENSLSAIKGYLMRLESGGDFKQPLSKIVDFLNVKAQELVQDISRRYANLYKGCIVVSKDAHEAVPEIIGNFRALIISGRNKEIFTLFDEHIESFGNFIEILRKYVVF